MATLTDSQKSQIRLALGYPDGWRYRNTRLESVMDNVSPQAVTQLTTLLSQLLTVEQQILDAAAAGSDNIKRVDEITFFDPLRNGQTVGFKSGKAAAKYIAARISIILGVPKNADAYGSAGYPGDSFSPGGFAGSGGGGMNFG